LLLMHMAPRGDSRVIRQQGLPSPHECSSLLQQASGKSGLFKCDYRFQSSVEASFLEPLLQPGREAELKDYKGAIRLYPGAAAIQYARCLQQTGTVRAYAGRYTGAMAEFDRRCAKTNLRRLLQPRACLRF